MIRSFQIQALSPVHGLPLPPGQRLPQGIPSYLVMALPDHGLYVMGEDHFGAGNIPWKSGGRKQKIAEDHIKSFLLQQRVQLVARRRSTILHDTVGIKRK